MINDEVLLLNSLTISSLASKPHYDYELWKRTLHNVSESNIIKLHIIHYILYVQSYI